MKKLFKLLFLLISFYNWAQTSCEYSTIINDSIQTYKETKSCLFYEKNFGGKTTMLTLSLVSNNGSPLVKLQSIQKSRDFTMPVCFDKTSKIIFQLSNNKIYTFIYAEEPVCDQLIYDDKDKIYNRFMESNFLFLKDDFTDLLQYPIQLMRIRFAGETLDYVIPNVIKSETINEIFYPSNYFRNNFNCIAIDN